MIHSLSNRSVQENKTLPSDSNSFPGILTEREAAEYLRLSARTLQKFRFEGRGPSYIKHEGGRGSIRYRKVDLEAYQMAHLIEPGKAGASH